VMPGAVIVFSVADDPFGAGGTPASADRFSDDPFGAASPSLAQPQLQPLPQPGSWGLIGTDSVPAADSWGAVSAPPQPTLEGVEVPAPAPAPQPAASPGTWVDPFGAGSPSMLQQQQPSPASPPGRAVSDQGDMWSAFAAFPDAVPASAQVPVKASSVGSTGGRSLWEEAEMQRLQVCRQGYSTALPECAVGLCRTHFRVCRNACTSRRSVAVS
jgi:hypothetical protein